MIATDIGDWVMTIIESDETQHQLEGSLCGGIAVDNIDMTSLIRSFILIDNLFVFDGLDIGDED
jgi:hypothetical protein